MENLSQEKDNLEKDFLNLAENYENLKNQEVPGRDILEMKSREIEELRQENEMLKSASFVPENSPMETELDQVKETLKKRNVLNPVETEKKEFERRFRERELEQELADARAKLELTSRQLELARKQTSPLEIQRVEIPARTEIIYEKVDWAE